jgi:NTE family protein
MRVVFIKIFVLSMFVTGGVFAQNINKKARPKIGLALSGGGAKGISHIGALMVLEKAGISVDYIVGTSMGSVVGALYAIGYSPDSIAYIARNENWDELLANNPGLRQIAIEEKSDFNRYIIELPIEGRRFRFPRGLIDGQELSVELSRLTFPVYDKKKFTDFPIPFKCVATDITNGEAVVLDSGNIADAIRASMAIPSFFTPVKYQNRLLVDGGIVRNFPVEHVKEMGADIIIGVNLSKGFLQEKELDNIIDILNQSMFLSDGEDTKRQREWCDFLIEPDLTGFHAGSFNAADSLIKRGYDAAMESFEDLQKLAKKLDKEFGQKESIQIPKIDSVLLTSFEVEDISKANRDLIIDRLNLTRNHWYKPDVFPEAMKKVYGTRYFRKVGYELFKYEDGTRIRLKGNENPPTFFNVALNYNSFSKAAIILNLTSRNLLGKNTRFSSTLNIADMLRFKSEYFKYLGSAKNHGLGVSFWFDNYDFPLYETFVRLAMYRQKYTALDIKYQIASLTVNSTGAGLRRELIVLTPNIYGSGENYDGSVVQDRVYLDFNLNTLNRHYYAHSGSKVNMNLSYFFNSNSNLKLISRDSLNGGFISKNMTSELTDSLITNRYLQFKLLSNKYIHINKKATLVLGFYGGLTFNPFSPKENANTIFNNFMVGGLIPNFRNQIPFIGLSDFQIRTNNFIGAQFCYQYEISKNLFVIPKFNLGYHNNNFVRYFTSNDVLKPSNQLFGYGITGGFNSILGPLDFTIMRNTQVQSFVFYVNLGYNF